MIRLPGANLSADVARDLLSYQHTVNSCGTYEARVESAKALFRQRNRPDNLAFRHVRDILDQICRGSRRCMYCEDSVADEVEHFRPKDFYPEFVFAWENYLYACGPCNGPKNNHFAIFSAATGARIDLRRRRGDPITEPEPGDPLLIDPRNEDPMDFIAIDLRDTFLFKEIHGPGTRERERARYTIEILHLNEREYLRVARVSAYEGYCGILHRYIDERDSHMPQGVLDRKVAAIRRSPHPTIWAEMKRQKDTSP